MSLTLNDISEKLKREDEVSLLEILEISSEELVDRFQDKVEEKLEGFSYEYEEDGEDG